MVLLPPALIELYRFYQARRARKTGTSLQKPASPPNRGEVFFWPRENFLYTENFSSESGRPLGYAGFRGKPYRVCSSFEACWQTLQLASRRVTNRCPWLAKASSPRCLQEIEAGAKCCKNATILNSAFLDDPQYSTHDFPAKRGAHAS